MTVVGTGLTTVAEAIAFLLELCALAAVAYWGYVEAGVWLAVAIPVAFAVFWGVFASPRAAGALPEWPKVRATRRRSARRRCRSRRCGQPRACARAWAGRSAG